MELDMRWKVAFTIMAIAVLGFMVYCNVGIDKEVTQVEATVLDIRETGSYRSIGGRDTVMVLDLNGRRLTLRNANDTGIVVGDKVLVEVITLYKDGKVLNTSYGRHIELE